MLLNSLLFIPVFPPSITGNSEVRYFTPNNLQHDGFRGPVIVLNNPLLKTMGSSEPQVGEEQLMVAAGAPAPQQLPGD